MEAALTQESYALVELLAYKFAHDNKRVIEYELFKSDGLEGLLKAIQTFDANSGAAFKSYATTCIKNAMCTSNKKQARFNLTQDENIPIEGIKAYADPKHEDNMVEVARNLILKANNNNKRNAEIFMRNIGLVNAPMDCKELSEMFNLTTERVRQVCRETRAALKKDKNATELLYSFVGAA